MIPPLLKKKTVTRANSIERSRRELQALATETLASSKRAIFALHRDDPRVASQELRSGAQSLKTGFAMIKKEPRIAYEGAWRAAQEEYAEAALFFHYLEHGEIEQIKEVSDDPDIFIGAVSDLTGEMLRKAVLLGGKRDEQAVEKMWRDVSAVVAFLLEMNLTGGLRTKVDQAKQNLRKLEEIRYDLAISKR